MSLNILFLHHVYSTISGHLPMDGAASCTIEMAEYLQKRGRNITIAGILDEGGDYLHNGVRYYHLGTDYDLSRHLPLLGKENFDVIQVLRGGCLQKVAEHFPGAKKVVRLVDVFFAAHEASPSMINELADEVIAVSSFVKESAIKWGIREEKITIVPVGIRTDIFCRLPEVCREKKLLVFAGATTPEKGIHLLLKGFLGILTAFPDARLEVYGAARLMARKEVIPWPKLERVFPNISYRGQQSKEELAKTFNRSALCIVPSLVPEGFTRVSIEAQACGCPVVCNAAGGLPETLVDGETGCVVKQMTHGNLSSTLISLLSGNRLAVMSSRAADHAKRFSVENAAQAFMQVLS